MLKDHSKNQSFLAPCHTSLHLLFLRIHPHPPYFGCEQKLCHSFFVPLKHRCFTPELFGENLFTTPPFTVPRLGGIGGREEQKEGHWESDGPDELHKPHSGKCLVRWLKIKNLTQKNGGGGGNTWPKCMFLFFFENAVKNVKSNLKFP